MTLVLDAPEAVIGADLARWGIYGRNGAGKTTIVGSIPPEIPTLVASIDVENVKPLLRKPHLYVARLTTWNELADLLFMFQSPSKSKLYSETLRKMAADPARREWLKALMNADPDIRSLRRPIWSGLAFDTWTRVQRLAVNKLIGYEFLKPNEEVDWINRSPKLPKGWDDWQQVGALAGEWMKYFERLPIHTIYLMQEQERNPKKEEDQSKIGPRLTPWALDEAMDSLEMMGRLYVDIESSKPSPDSLSETPAPSLFDEADDGSSKAIDPNAKEVRRLLIGQHPRYVTKGPTHRLGYVATEPTWASLATSLEG